VRGLKLSKVMEFEGLSCNDLGEYLTAQGIHEDVVAVFNANRICGEAFMEFQENDLREMLPVIGDRVRIRKLLDSLKQVKLHFYVSFIVRFFSQGVMPNLSVRPVVVSLPSPLLHLPIPLLNV